MGLEEFVCFKESIRRCPKIPWNMDPQHLHAVDQKVKELQEEQKEKWGYHPTLIRRIEKSYIALLERSKSEYYGITTEYDIAFFQGPQLVDVVPASSLECNAPRLKKTILSENKKEHQESDYMKELGYWKGEDNIPTDKRSIKELQETGISIVPVKRNKQEIPEVCSACSEAYLRSTAFLEGANIIAGYHEIISIDRVFPFIRTVYRGYLAIISRSQNS